MRSHCLKDPRVALWINLMGHRLLGWSHKYAVAARSFAVQLSCPCRYCGVSPVDHFLSLHLPQYCQAGKSHTGHLDKSPGLYKSVFHGRLKSAIYLIQNRENRRDLWNGDDRICSLKILPSKGCQPYLSWLADRITLFHKHIVGRSHTSALDRWKLDSESKVT